MKNKPNIKINVGFTYQVIKSELDLDGSFDEMEVRQIGPPKPGACKTKQIELCNIENVKPAILNLKDNIEKQFHSSLDKLVGSGWSIKRFDTMFVTARTNKIARGPSYIETPAKFSS